MNDNAYDESLLLAYVDGRTDAGESARVETLLQSNPAAQRCVERLRCSELPYRDAFASALNDPAPQPLVDFIEQWRDAEPRTSVRPSLKRSYAYAAVLLLGLLLGHGATLLLQPSDATPAWLAQVASYHELYVRETVAAAQASPETKLHLRETMQRVFDTELAIPDLTSIGLEFKRGQLLQIDGAPLLQLAYLPERGVPLALCLTPRGEPDRDIVYGNSHNLQYASWSSNGISYVLLGASTFAPFARAAQSAAAQI